MLKSLSEVKAGNLLLKFRETGDTRYQRACLMVLAGANIHRAMRRVGLNKADLPKGLINVAV